MKCEVAMVVGVSMICDTLRGYSPGTALHALGYPNDVKYESCSCSPWKFKVEAVPLAKSGST